MVTLFPSGTSKTICSVQHFFGAVEFTIFPLIHNAFPKPSTCGTFLLKADGRLFPGYEHCLFLSTSRVGIITYNHHIISSWLCALTQAFRSWCSHIGTSYLIFRSHLDFPRLIRQQLLRARYPNPNVFNFVNFSDTVLPESSFPVHRRP